jgi:hypothetical protein
MITGKNEKGGAKISNNNIKEEQTFGSLKKKTWLDLARESLAASNLLLKLYFLRRKKYNEIDHDYSC